jgi:hypothetical protein
MWGTPRRRERRLA